jgi:hypothetical protein
MKQRCRAALWILVLAALISMPALAGPYYLGGNVSNMTTTAQGVYIMLDSGVPENCKGTPYGWMVIREANKTMAAAVLAMWASGRRGATVYTSGIDGTGYCIINQVHPHG